MASNQYELYFFGKLFCFLALAYFYGLLTALCTAIGFSFGSILILWGVFGYKPLMGAELAFYANKHRPTNVIGVLHVDGTNVDDVIPLIKKLPYYPSNTHMQRKIVSILGENYWSPPLKNLNLNQHIHVMKMDLKNYQDVVDFAAEIIDEPLPSDRPLWEVYVVDGFKKKQLVLFFKVNHSLTDGLSSINCIIGNMADDYKGLVHRLPVIPWSRKLLTVLVMPIYSIYLLARTLLSKKDSNIFSQRQLLGKNIVTTCKKIQLSKLKTISKENNATINDVLTATTLTSIKRYMNKYGEGQDNGDHIKAGFPMIMKENKNGLKAINLDPKLTILYIDLPLPQETHKLTISFIHSVRNVLSGLKNSFEPLVAYYISTYLLPLVPFALAVHMLCYLADKMSFIFSNLAGCPERLHVCGREVKSMYCIPPNFSGIPFAMTVTSYGEDVRIACMSNQLSRERLEYMMDELYDVVAE